MAFGVNRVKSARLYACLLLLFLVLNYALRLDVSHEETRTLPNRTATHYLDLFAATQCVVRSAIVSRMAL